MGYSPWGHKESHTTDRLILALWGFPGPSDSKESTFSARDLGLIPGLGRYPGEGKGYPLQYSGLYSLWGRKQSNTTEQLSLSFHLQKLSILQSTDKIINRYYYY